MASGDALQAWHRVDPVDVPGDGRVRGVVVDGRTAGSTWAGLLAPLDGLHAPVVALADDPTGLGPLLRERAAGLVVLAADGPDAGLRVALGLCGALGRLASGADVRA